MLRIATGILLDLSPKGFSPAFIEEHAMAGHDVGVVKVQHRLHLLHNHPAQCNLVTHSGRYQTVTWKNIVCMCVCVCVLYVCARTLLFRATQTVKRWSISNSDTEKHCACVCVLCVRTILFSATQTVQRWSISKRDIHKPCVCVCVYTYTHAEVNAFDESKKRLKQFFFRHVRR